MTSVGKPKPRAFHYVTVDYLDGPRDPWATIIFMYRGKSKSSTNGPPYALLNCIDETLSSAEQLQKMGFTMGIGPARRSSCGIFEPGSSRSLNLNRMGYHDDGMSDDQDTPTKKRGSTNCIPKEGKRSPAGAEESSLSASKPRLTTNASSHLPLAVRHC